MTLIASGAVDHDAILRIAEEKFASLSPGISVPPVPARWVGGDTRKDDDLEQAHMTFAFQGLAQTDPDIYALQVYVTALGGGMSSRLFQEIREKRGLCYTISAFGQVASDSGIVGIYTGTGAAEAGQIAPVVAGEMEALAASATAPEVARAKAQLKSSLLMGLEKPSSRAEQIAGQMFFYGRVIDAEELTRKLDEVDTAAVRRVGERIMNSDRPAMASLGPIGDLESYESFAARFGSGVAMRAAE
jgi:predicted Zn-dependent peptidase